MSSTFSILMKKDIIDCLAKNFSNDKTILSWKESISHSGFDKFGPKSNLHDLGVLYENCKKIYFIEFHKEDNISGKKEDYYPIYSEPKRIDSLLSKNSYYSVNFINDLNILFLNKFPDLAIEIIFEFLVRKKYIGNDLNLNKRQVGEGILLPFGFSPQYVINIR